jgi:hypothetical protein
MNYQIKRHEAIIPAPRQKWDNGRESWKITNILKIDGVPYQVVVVDLCSPRARTKVVSMKYFQRKFQHANVWLPLPRLKKSTRRLARKDSTYLDL